jgi:2'-5' RNA ligase
VDNAAVVETASAVLVVVREAEPVVGRFRVNLDRSAGWGVPPHVTVLYPFLPPDRIDAAAIARLGEVVATVPAFDLVFARLDWFDDNVVWLAPEPDRPLRVLTAAVHASFPDYPPYGGEHDDPIPHLTIGHDSPVDVLRSAATEVEPQLPIRVSVSTVELLVGSPEPDSWRTIARLPLAGANVPTPPP